MHKTMPLNKRAFIIIITTTLLLLSSLCFGATYYVDATNGNDNYSGLSPETPWQTIAKVNASNYQAGDFILFKRGEIWREQLTVPSSGTASNPITLRPYGSGNKPVINGADALSSWTSESIDGTVVYYAYAPIAPNQVFEDNSRLIKSNDKHAMSVGTWYWDSGNTRIYVRATGNDKPSGYTIEASQRNWAIKVSTKDYIIIENINVKNGNYGGICVTNSSNVIFNNCTSSHNYQDGFLGVDSDDLTVSNNIIKHNGRDGIRVVWDSDNWVIEKNIVHNNVELDYENWLSGIHIVDVTCSNIIVQENIIHTNGLGKDGSRGYGIWLDTVGSGNIIRRNKCYNNNKSGIFVEDSDAVQVYYNISYNNTSHGIMISRNCSDNLVYNNTICGNNIGLIAMGTYGGSADDFTGNIFKNNIIFGNKVAAIRATYGGENDGVNGYGNVYTYNCFGLESTNFIEWGVGVFKSTYDDWETSYGSSTYSVESDPQMTNPSNDDFTLQPSSPCIDAGIDVGLSQDYRGNRIPIGRGVDIGAFEYQPISAPKNLKIYELQDDR